MLRLLYLIMAVVCNTRAQLLAADRCGIGYQYRYPPELLTCRADITVTRLRCWVAIPTDIPVGTSVDVAWYRRSLEESERGSNTSFLVENSPPFQYVKTLCDRDPICPDAVDNLTVHLHQLEINNFGAGLEGDYTCRLMLMNQTTGTVEQTMQPSACTRVQLASDQVQNCQVVGQRLTWTCADSDQQLGECPREFSISTVPTSVVTPSSTTSLTPNTSSFSYSTLQTSHHREASTGVKIRPLTSLSPTPTGVITSVEEPSDSLGTIYVVVGIIALILVVGIVTTASIAIGIRIMRQKRVVTLKDGRAPTYVIAPRIYRDSPNLGGSVDLKRNSTIYSKPTWPGGETITPTEHTYATIPGEQDSKWESSGYSYAYQSDMFPTHQSSKQAEEASEKAHRPYEKIQTIDYIQMYSQPSPLLLSSSDKSSSVTHKEEKGYTHLDTKTLDPQSVYTNAGHKPENMN